MSLSELCDDDCPQQLFDCPFSFSSIEELGDPDSDRLTASLQLHPQPSDQCPEWARESPQPHDDDDHCFLNSCFYQLHMQGRPFVSDGCGVAAGGAHASHTLQVEFNLPSTSASSSALLSSNFQAFGGLLHPQHCLHSPPQKEFGVHRKVKSEMRLCCSFALQRNIYPYSFYTRKGWTFCTGVELVINVRPLLNVERIMDLLKPSGVYLLNTNLLKHSGWDEGCTPIFKITSIIFNLFYFVIVFVITYFVLHHAHQLLAFGKFQIWKLFFPLSPSSASFFVFLESG